MYLPIPVLAGTTSLQKFFTVTFYLRCCYLVAQSCPTLFGTPWTAAHQAPLSMGFPGKHTGVSCLGVSCHFLLQRIFLTQGLNPSLLHCRPILYCCATGEGPFVYDVLKAKGLLLRDPTSKEKSWLTGKDSDAGRDWGQEEKGTTEDGMAGWHHRLDGHESEWTPGVGDGQGGLVCCDSWRRKESDTTERLNWTELRN